MTYIPKSKRGKELNRLGRLYVEFSNKIFELAREIEKEDPELAKKIEEHSDDIVKWYIMHKREMTLEDFLQILK